MFGNAFIAIMGIVVWVAVALWPAYIAKRKGYSFLLFFIGGIFISWLLTLLIVSLLKDKLITAEEIADDEAAEEFLDNEEEKGIK
ncbi:MAG: hypothetical protein WCI60_00145 [bacterium]|jgi:uncharacterized membrane protein YqjE